jgi:hypothetical protein
MKQFHHGSITRYVALNVIALCALLLQALSPVAASIAGGDPGGAICLSDESRSNPPLEKHRHTGFCCILACSAHHSAYVATGYDLATFTRRDVTSHHWDLRDSDWVYAPRKFSFLARGPPAAP